MKKFKINLLAIIGMMVAVATVAFTAPKAEVDTSRSMQLTWYEVNDDGEIKNSIPNGPSGDCVVDLQANICAVLLETTSPPEHFDDLDQDEIEGIASRL